MSIIVLLVFISLILVLGSILLFGFSVSNQDLEQGEQISLQPLEEETYANSSDHL